MAKFNKNSTPKTTKSYEGATLYEKDPLEAWFSFLFSSYLSDKFYEDSQTQMERFLQLTDEVSKAYGNEFVAKASFFARNELGLRSISQLTAAYLNGQSFEAKREFFRNFFHRPDDVAEVFAAIDMLEGKRSHALVRGAGDYLSGLNDYALGKYKMNGKDYNMYDLINITHANSKAIDAYKAGTLESPDTWEVSISTSKSTEEKNENWCQLVEYERLGYLALIRNLRNIIIAASEKGKGYGWLADILAKQVTNPKAIKKSLVFPYQIYSAYKALVDADLQVSCIIQALESAFLMSLDNVPNLEGNSCLMLDVSGSMESCISPKSNITIKEAGACYAAMLLLKNPATIVVKFGSNARVFNKFHKYCYTPFQMIQALCDNDSLGYGTDVPNAFYVLESYMRRNDISAISRIFLISDEQTMGDVAYWYHGNRKPLDIYNDYCREFGRTKLYSFDLSNYAGQVANPNNPDVFLATTLSDKIFTFIELLENGDNLYNYINKNYSYKSPVQKAA